VIDDFDDFYVLIQPVEALSSPDKFIKVPQSGTFMNLSGI
jgi:hypothetical protein